MKRGRSEDGRDEKPINNLETSPSRAKTQYLYRLFALHPSVSRNARDLIERCTESTSSAGGASGRTLDLSTALNQTTSSSSIHNITTASHIAPSSKSCEDSSPSEVATQLTILVTTAAGHQGSAVARSLLASSTPISRVHVRCLVRNPSCAVSKALQSLGAHIYQGDFSSTSVLGAAAKGCDAVFLNTQTSAGDEEQQARNVLHAASAGGVRHIVASTSARVEEYQSFKVFQECPTHPMLGYFRGKAAVQALLHEWVGDSPGSAANRFFTILQPAWIMTNFLAPCAESYWGPRLASNGVFSTAFTPETKVPLISGRDVGRFAAHAFTDVACGGEQRQRWAGKIVPMAGEELTMEEIAKMIGQVGGRKLAVEYRTDLNTKEQRDADPYIFFQWWETLDGSGVDLNEMQEFGVQTTTFREFLEENRERLRETFGVGS